MSRPLPPGAKRAALVGGAAVALAFGAAWYRGSRVEAEEKSPASAAEGTRCQLLERSGRRAVRCARVLDAPPAAVVAVVRDYPHFPEIFSASYAKLALPTIADEPGDVVHLVGSVQTVVHDFVLDLRVKHEQRGDAFVASWSEGAGAMVENTGSWTVQPAPGGGALVAYELEARVPRVPAFLVNGWLLGQIPYPIARVADAVRARAPAAASARP